ncbi:MAG TPA: DUF1028 domain-containing protein [Xanthobacteraceae bacterium]|nr:DUF1028 domain-containing protein [Xanthobacteraceae bacterium]
MTYCIIARCPRTGRLGLGVASYSFSIGMYCSDAMRANTGVSITLGAPNPGNNALAVRLLAQGFTSAQVLAQLIENDVNSDYRQIGVMDREGNVAGYTGTMTRPWCGQLAGKDYMALGDMLAGQGVLDALAEGYAADPAASLEDRLLVALEAGRDAGGQVGKGGRLPARSAAIVVAGIFDYSDWDLRVDAHDEAVDELRRVHKEFKLYADYYVERARSPRNAKTQMEFADMVAGDQPKEMPKEMI